VPLLLLFFLALLSLLISCMLLSRLSQAGWEI